MAIRLISKAAESFDVYLRDHAKGTAEAVESDDCVAHGLRRGRVVRLKGSTKCIDARRYETDRRCDDLVHQDSVRVREETVRQSTEGRKLVAFKSAGHSRSFGEKSPQIRPCMTDMRAYVLLYEFP